jgi:succinyl-CoA synthetase beta subunit
MQLITPQTPPEGVKVRSVLVEEATEIAKEIYVAVLIDRQAALPVIIASEAGGMNIEEVAATTPEKILRVHVDPIAGFQPYLGRQIAYALNIPEPTIRPVVDLLGNLYRLFEQKDCSLAEINPLIITADNRVLALDAKLNFDDNALYRHPDVVTLRDVHEESPLEVEASRYDLTYIKLDGSVGCMVNGAGLAMATMDLTTQIGASPANFLDVGGGAQPEKVAQALKIILSDPDVKAVLINTFCGILRGDILAEGVIRASREVEVKVPIVVRLIGTNAEQGLQMLQESGLKITTARELSEAAEKVAEALKSVT